MTGAPVVVADTRRRARGRVLVTGCVMLLLSALAVGTGSPASAQAREAAPEPSSWGGSPGVPVVHTRYGQLRGVDSGAVQEFLGVPYAAAPVGDLRFRSPAPPPRWRGVRDATSYGPACTQFLTLPGQPVGPTSEDCLSLNVWTPKDAGRGSRLPVLVFYHGGGLAFGAGSQYQGQELAAQTHSVVVTINYRLGALGYLALPQLDAENSHLGSGNYGLEDQIEALRWVRGNVSAFGGDARQVTLAGESAGGSSVCAALASPEAAGLFQRATIQSAPCSLPTAPRAAAEETGTALAVAAGCTDPATTVACLRAADPSTLVDAASQAGQFGLVSGGGALVPVPPSEAIASGRWNRVPVLIGSNRHEGKLFALPPFAPPGVTTQLSAADLDSLIRSTYGPLAEQVLASYPLSAYPATGGATPAWYALAEILGDRRFSCPTVTTADTFSRQVPTYRYEFDDPTSAGPLGLNPPGVDMSSAHTTELAYLWNWTVASRPLTGPEQQLSQQMIRSWGVFLWAGSSNTAGRPSWLADRSNPAWSPAQQNPLGARQVLSLRPTGSQVITVEQFETDHRCALWSAVAAS